MIVPDEERAIFETRGCMVGEPLGEAESEI